MSLDPDLPYTFKSQYLLHATLLGNNDVNLVGNDQDNRLGPNSGFNTLDGGAGKDTAVFQGRCAEYVAGIGGGGGGDGPPGVRLSDQVPGRDGATMLMNIEVIEFSDSRNSFPFDLNDDGYSLLCPASPSPDGAEDVPSKELEGSGDADAPGTQDEEIAVPAAGGDGLTDENPSVDEGDHTNTTESHPDGEIKREEEEETDNGGGSDPQAGDGTGLEDERDDPAAAVDELRPDGEDAEATTDGGGDQENDYEGPDEALADTNDAVVEEDNTADENSAANATDTVPPDASPITIQGSEEQVFRGSYHKTY